MSEPILSFQTVEEFKVAANIPEDDPEDDDRLQGALNDGAATIQRELHRTLLPVDDTTRLYSAPVGSLLLIPDCRRLIAVTAFGVTLTAGIDYLTINGPEELSYWALLRLDPLTGEPLYWRTLPVGATLGQGAFRKVAVQADWGLRAYPSELVTLNTNVSVQIWRLREHRFAAEGSDTGYLGRGEVPAGLLNTQAKTVIASYQRARIAQIGGD